MPHFSRTTPIGCLLGFFWLIFAGIDGLLYLLAYRQYQQQPPMPAGGRDALIAAIVLSAVLGLVCLPLLKRCLASRPGHYDNGRGISK